jgi:hypothetical protein
MVIAAAAKCVEKTRSQAKVREAQQCPLRCAAYNSVCVCKEEGKRGSSWLVKKRIIVKTPRQRNSLPVCVCAYIRKCNGYFNMKKKANKMEVNLLFNREIYSKKKNFVFLKSKSSFINLKKIFIKINSI